MSVVVWHAYHGAEEQALVDVAEAVEARTGADVQIVAVPFGGFDAKVETAVPRGNGPDLLISGHANIGKWSKLGVIEPLTPIAGLRPFTVEALNRIVEEALSSNAWAG